MCVQALSSSSWGEILSVESAIVVVGGAAAMSSFAGVQLFLDWPTLARLQQCSAAGVSEELSQYARDKLLFARQQLGTCCVRMLSRRFASNVKDLWLEIGMPLCKVHGQEVRYCPGIAACAWVRVYVLGLAGTHSLGVRAKRSLAGTCRHAEWQPLVPRADWDPLAILRDSNGYDPDVQNVVRVLQVGTWAFEYHHRKFIPCCQNSSDGDVVLLHFYVCGFAGTLVFNEVY